MANLNSIAKKLQKAILQKGLVIKMGTSQFYSVEQNRLITMHILSTRVLERKKNGEWKYYDYEIIRTASQIEIVNCLYMEGGERMMENYTEIPVELNKPGSRDVEEMQKELIDMIAKNEKLKEKNEYLQKEVEDAKAVEKRALCEVQELIAKNKRLVEEHNRQNGTIQALNIALDVITDRYSNLRKRLCRTGKGGE